MRFKKILLIITLIFFAVSFIYTFYRSEIINQGLFRDYYLKYYILSFLSLAFLFFVKKLDEGSSKKITSITIFIFFIFYGFEFILFYNKSNIENKRQEYFKNYLKQNEIPFEKRDKFDIYLESKKKDPNIFLATDPYHFLKTNEQIFPLSSLSNIKTILCNEYGLLSEYQSDRYGFSNPDFEWENEIDYLILGDAYAHGNCVKQKDSISGILRKLNGGKGVLNFGFGGNGPLIKYAQLREYLNLINVKKVLWFYSETDDLEGPDFRDPKKFEGLKAELTNNILKKYIDDLNFSQKLSSKQNIVDEMSSKKNEEILRTINISKKNKNFTLLSLFKLTNLRNYISKHFTKSKPEKINQKISKEFKQIINLTSELLEKKNTQFYFIYITDIDRYSKLDFDSSENDYDKIREFIESKKNITFIDLHNELFAKHQNPLSLFTKQFQNDYQHYNILGYKLVSEKIYEIINND